MDHIFFTPARYIQGPGIIRRAGTFFSGRYSRCLAVVDEFIFNMMAPLIREGFMESGTAIVLEHFKGECCEEEISRLVSVSKPHEADVLMAVGGGKALDAGKVLSDRLDIPCVVAPTIASTDAPTSSIAVLYTSEHRYVGSVRVKGNPQMVLVDTDIISKAPARFLVAGMGDALATRFEAEACAASGAANLHGHRGTESAMHLARLAYDIIMDNGIAAMGAVNQKKVTLELEKVIEANILMSGLGWENGGLAIPHAFHGALTAIDSFKDIYHGERVALGVLLQLEYEGGREEILQKLRAFYKQVGLPLSLSQISTGAVTKEHLDIIMKGIIKTGSLAFNMPGGLNADYLRTVLESLVF
jgi:glycerol dehydrogenase